MGDLDGSDESTRGGAPILKIWLATRSPFVSWVFFVFWVVKFFETRFVSWIFRMQMHSYPEVWLYIYTFTLHSLNLQYSTLSPSPLPTNNLTIKTKDGNYPLTRYHHLSLTTWPRATPPLPSPWILSYSQLQVTVGRWAGVYWRFR